MRSPVEVVDPGQAFRAGGMFVGSRLTLPVKGDVLGQVASHCITTISGSTFPMCLADEAHTEIRHIIAVNPECRMPRTLSRGGAGCKHSGGNNMNHPPSSRAIQHAEPRPYCNTVTYHYDAVLSYAPSRASTIWLTRRDLISL